MFLRFSTIALVISVILLLFALLPLTSFIDPIAISQGNLDPIVLISVNGIVWEQENNPVEVLKGEAVKIRVQIYNGGQLRHPGEFSYDWCFEPPIKNNPYCHASNYKGDTNSDYIPQDSNEQTLNIHIQQARLGFAAEKSITFLPK